MLLSRLTLDKALSLLCTCFLNNKMGWSSPSGDQEGGQPSTLYLARVGRDSYSFSDHSRPLYSDGPPFSHPPMLLFKNSNSTFPSLSLQDTFVELYGNNAAAESRKGQERFNRWLLTGVTVAGVVLLGSLFSRK